jgi:hypothetical protein
MIETYTLTLYIMEILAGLKFNWKLLWN